MSVMGLVDIHCHVLPGLDDGAGRISDALGMLEKQAEDGVTTVAATPHLRSDFPDIRPRDLAAHCRSLEADAADAGIFVSVVPGGELDLMWAREASPADLRNVSLGGHGRHLLIETPHNVMPLGFEDLVMSFTRAGYGVVLAHPELSRDLQLQPERLAWLAKRGVMLQVTASSLLRSPKKSRSAALARRLVSEGLCHFIATDAHSAGPWRAPDLHRGALQAVRLAGARGEWMVTEAPAALLAGEEIPAPPSGGKRTVHPLS